MSYTPTNWKAGDTVTSEKLNKIEQGIAENILPHTLIVNYDEGVGDKTWQEIMNAVLEGRQVYLKEIVDETTTYLRSLKQISFSSGAYYLMFNDTQYVAYSPNEYIMIDA